MHYIEHYDPELDLAFEIPELDPSEYPDLESFFVGEEHSIRLAAYSALYNALQLGLDQVPTFALKGSHSVVTLVRENYAAQLEKCLEYFAQLEEYEACAELAELKKKL